MRPTSFTALPAIALWVSADSGLGVAGGRRVLERTIPVDPIRSASHVEMNFMATGRLPLSLRTGGAAIRKEFPGGH